MSFTDLDKSLSTPPLSPNSKDDYLSHSSSKRPLLSALAPVPVNLPAGLQNVTRGSSRDSIGLRHHFAQHPPSPNYTRLQALQAQQQQQQLYQQLHHLQSYTKNSSGSRPSSGHPIAETAGVGSPQEIKKVRDDTPRPTLHGHVVPPPSEIQHSGSGRPLIVSSPLPPPSKLATTGGSTPYLDQFHQQQQKFYSQTPTPMTRVITSNLGGGGNGRGVAGEGKHEGARRDEMFSPHRPALSSTAVSGGPLRFSPDSSPVTSRWNNDTSGASTTGHGGLATPTSPTYPSSFSPTNSYQNHSRDHPEDAYQLSGDLSPSTPTPSGLTEQQQYDYESRQLSQQIFNLSSNISVLERLIPCIGQRHKDTVEMRESLHSVLDHARDLVKSAHTQVKYLARFHLPQSLQPHFPATAPPARRPTYGSIGAEFQPLLHTNTTNAAHGSGADRAERGLMRRPMVQYSDLTTAQQQVVTSRRLTHQRLTKDLTIVTKAFQDLQRRAIEAERQQVAQLRRLSSTCASLRRQSAASMEDGSGSDEEEDDVEDVPIVDLDLNLKVKTANDGRGILYRPDSDVQGGGKVGARRPQGEAVGQSQQHSSSEPSVSRRPRHPQQLPPSASQNPQQQHPRHPPHPHDRQLSVQEQAHLHELQWMDTELELQEAILQEREEEIHKIEQGMTQVLQVMQELGAMVHEQRAGVDMLQDSISSTRTRVELAHQEIVRAGEYDRKRRERLCYMLLIVSVVVTVVLLALT